MQHTGLGEKGAEAMVGVGGFALLGQVSIRLDEWLAREFSQWCRTLTYLNAMLKAVKLQMRITMSVQSL
jgi:hypothetical protein